MLRELDLSNVVTVGVDETASQRGHRYVTVFLDMQRKQEPVVFAVPGCGKDVIKAFNAFLATHGGRYEQCGRGRLRNVASLPQRGDRVPSQGRGHGRLVPYRADLHQATGRGTQERATRAGTPQVAALGTTEELGKREPDTQTAGGAPGVGSRSERHCRCLGDQGEAIRWLQKAPTPRAARWRITNYLKVMQAAVSEKPLLKPMGKALTTLERHANAVVRRWRSGLTNARLEGMRPVRSGQINMK